MSAATVAAAPDPVGEQQPSLVLGRTEVGEAGALFVLEAPRFESDAWVAQANTVPITNITTLVDKITFASGKGLKVGPGKLGMSLQTPRVLCESDVALLDGGPAKRTGTPYRAGHAQGCVSSHESGKPIA